MWFVADLCNSERNEGDDSEDGTESIAGRKRKTSSSGKKKHDKAEQKKSIAGRLVEINEQKWSAAEYNLWAIAIVSWL